MKFTSPSRIGLSVLSQSKIDNERLKKIRQELNKSRHKFSKSEINEIRKISTKQRAKENISTPKIKDTEKNLSILKKYHDQDDAKYVAITDVVNLFSQSTDKDYYKAIETKSAFNANYIEYEAIGTKIKILQLKDILI